MDIGSAIAQIEGILAQLKAAHGGEMGEMEAEESEVEMPGKIPNEADVNGGAEEKIEGASMKKDLVKAMMKKKGY